MQKTLPLLKYLQKTKDITRRDFEEMLKEEVIFLNGEKIDSFQSKIKIGDNLKIYLPSGETFEENIERLPTIRPVIVVFNKPKGYVVSKDDKFNKTIFELLPDSWKKDFYYIGRLDKSSHGLLLLTNDPELVDQYESPRKGIPRVYEVKVNIHLKSADLQKAKKGILVNENDKKIPVHKRENEKYIETLKFNDINKIGNSGKMLRIMLKQGKKRHIRRLLKALGYNVTYLKRVEFGKYQLGDIKVGKYKIFK